MPRKTVRHAAQGVRRPFRHHDRSGTSAIILRMAEVDSAADSASRLANRKAAAGGCGRGSEASAESQASRLTCRVPDQDPLGRSGIERSIRAEFQPAHALIRRVRRLEEPDRQGAKLVAVLLSDLEQSALAFLASP